MTALLEKSDSATFISELTEIYKRDKNTTSVLETESNGNSTFYVPKATTSPCRLVPVVCVQCAISTLVPALMTLFSHLLS